MRNRLKTQLSLPTTYSGFVAALQKLSGSADSGVSGSGSADRMDISAIGSVHNAVSISTLLDADLD